MNKIKQKPFHILLTIVLFWISTILLIKGINDINNIDKVEKNIELTEIYIDYGYSSIVEWRNDYKQNILLLFIGGAVCSIFAIWLLIKQKIF